MPFVKSLLAVFSVFFLLPANMAYSNGCGVETPCQISGKDGGTYYFSKPSAVNGAESTKAFVFFHGHNGSGKGIIRNSNLIQSLHRAGYIVIAPDGPLFTFRGRSVRGWAARPEEGTPRGIRDDIAFVENVLGDVAAKAGIDPKQTVVSGFSSGGSMAWYFSCYSKMPLAGVIAIAGGLRRPLPDNGNIRPDGAVAKTCPAGPRRMLHIHGFSDRQVPLEGRRIRDWHQGDVFEGLAVQRHTNTCASRPDRVSTDGPFWCRAWTKCGSGHPVRLCLHAGGHGTPRGWLDEGLGWLNKR